MIEHPHEQIINRVCNLLVPYSSLAEPEPLIHRAPPSDSLFKGLVTLSYIGRSNGMQLKEVLHVKSHNTHVKMEGRRLFCAACGDLERVRNAFKRRKLGSTSTSSWRIHPLWKSLLMNVMMKDRYHQYHNDVFISQISSHLVQTQSILSLFAINAVHVTYFPRKLSHNLQYFDLIGSATIVEVERLV